MRSNRTTTFLTAVAILLCTASAFADVATSPEPVARVSLPAPAAQTSAAKFVADAFADQIAKAKKPSEKKALAQKMLQTGADERKDMANRYALLTAAMNTAVAAGDLADACLAVDEMDQTFIIDALKMKSQSALAAVRAAHAANDRKSLVMEIVLLVDQAVADDRYDIALQLGDVAIGQARLSNDALLLKQAAARVQRAKAIETAYRDLKIAVPPAIYKSSDPATSMKVGKFLCFFKGDWDHGVAMLAIGGDSTLKELAVADLKAPTDAQQQYTLAERWWNFADSASAMEKTQIRGRASYWYQQATPNLSGLPQALAKKRAAEGADLASGPSAGERGWVVLFRSADPSIWNSDTNKGHDSFAIGLAKAPEGIQFLRLSRSTSECLIIPMTGEQLAKNSAEKKGEHGWNGDNRFNCKAYHLGIFSRDIPRPTGDVDIGAGGIAGWGFGNHISVDDKQAYGWAGKELGATVFEIAVKTMPLTKAEKTNFVE